MICLPSMILMSLPYKNMAFLTIVAFAVHGKNNGLCEATTYIGDHSVHMATGNSS